MSDKVIEVSCAIVMHEKKVLVTQRGRFMLHARKWEFPGGKLHVGENPEQALLREILEELDIKVRAVALLPRVEQDYPDRSIYMYPFICEWAGGEIKLLEHARYRWLDPDELDDLDWLPADIKVVEQLKAYLEHITP